MRPVTPKQEKYVQGLVAGLSQRQAYRAAYSAERMKDNTVDRKAFGLLAQGNVRARYEELQAEAAAGVVYDRQRAISDLIEIVDIGLAHIRQTRGHKANFTEKSSRELADLPRGAATVLSAIDRLDKLLGLSETDGDGRVAVIDDV